MTDVLARPASAPRAPAPKPAPTVTPDAASRADLDKFRVMLDRYLAGDLDEDVFRVFRLNNGVYGQRQQGHNQMLRCKVPYGSLLPEQLEMFAYIADTYSRGWGHITTRQNVQFHFVQLGTVPSALEDLASVGITTREACGDTVRNVMGCHLAGACPYEVLDISPWAEATFRHFLHSPIAQRLPRKFKINFSGCATDCGQAMFNDVGVIAVNRPRDDGTVEAGFRVFFAGGLGANPHPAQALEEFTPREELLPTIEAVLRVFDHHGNRDNKLRARMKWLQDKIGLDELRRQIFRERRLLPASATWPGGIPAIVHERGDAPAGVSGNATPVGVPVTLRLGPGDPRRRWEQANVVRGAAKGTVSAVAYCPLGDVTSAQFVGLANLFRSLGGPEGGVSLRVTNRQNIVLRGLREDQLDEVYAALEQLGMAEPGAELARDVVACPGADTCNLAVTQSRGLAEDIGRALEEAGLADVGGVRINISGCTNSCGQHHISDIGFYGAERRAHGQSGPGYQMLLGGRVGQAEVEFGAKALRLPAKRAGEATVRVVERFAAERDAGEAFGSWLDRAGGAAAVGKDLKDLDEWPTPEERPDFYIDFGETGPYVAETGESECAT
ncbi:MAG TPA: nitrite/sulfite reductase [Acidimicrobiales bacterium]|nr:nitrite/sulfite reductase [Acidimicrobiales bacterium]